MFFARTLVQIVTKNAVFFSLLGVHFESRLKGVQFGNASCIKFNVTVKYEILTMMMMNNSLSAVRIVAAHITVHRVCTGYDHHRDIKFDVMRLHNAIR